MGFVKRFGLFVGWLSGSAAGLAALLYALGFLVTLGNLNLLGINFFLIGFEPVFYISRGANFILYLAFELGHFLIVLAPLVVIIPVLKWGFTAFYHRLSMGSPGTGRLIGRYRPLVGYGLLLGYLYLVLTRYLSRFSAITSVSGLLLAPAEGFQRFPPDLLLPWCDPLLAQAQFRILFLVALGTLVVTLLAFKTTHDWRWHSWRPLLLTPFVVMALIFGLLVPVAYGSLLVGGQLAFVSIRFREGNTLNAWFVSKAPEEVVVWDNTQESILWIPKESLFDLRLGKAGPLRELSPLLRSRCDAE